MVSDPANRADREQLLASITRKLQADDRVRAVWLAGSLGRGNADDLSDIDIWIAASDDLMNEVIADPTAWVQARCATSLAFTIPQNSPPGGTYVFSLIRCPHGLQQVDWYWAPAISAVRQQNTTIVFERDPVSLAAAAPRLNHMECEEVALFWCRETLGMAHIAIKDIRRDAPFVDLQHLTAVLDLAGTARFVHQHRRQPAHDDPRDVSFPRKKPTTTTEQFRFLRDLLALLAPVLAALPERDRAELIATRDAIRASIDRQLDA